MSMDVSWVPYGRPAAQALHARIAAAKAGDALRPVSVVVPTNFVGVSVRRLLASGQLGPTTSSGVGLAGVTFLTVYRLAELLGAPRLAAGGRRPVSTPVLAAAVRGVLREDPGRFAPVANHPATEAALVRAHRELSEVDETALGTLAATGSRAADVVRLHRRVRASLAGAWYDEADLLAAATTSALDGAPVLTDLGTLLVYLPQALPPAAARLLGALAQGATVEVLAGCSGAPSADADVATTLARLGVEVASPPAIAPAAATEVVFVSDAEEEARTAVRRLVEALREGIPLERMAVLYPLAQPYARLVHEHLAAAGLGSNGQAVRPLGDRLLGRWLLDLLALGDHDLRRQDLFHLLAGGPVRIPGGGPVPVASWERVSRAAGVVRGHADWDQRLARYAEQARNDANKIEASGEEEDEEDRLIQRLLREADDAERLRGFVLRLFGSLFAGARAERWSAMVDWARGLLVRYLGGEDARADWPEVERVAADKVEDALDRLAALDAVEAAPSLAVFRRTLELELDADLARVGRFGEGVLVGPLSAALGVDLDVVIVLGLAEGVLPTRVREDSLLPDVERAACRGQLRLRADTVAVEHRRLLAALAASARHRILSYPRGDLRRSVERAPSRWLLDAVAELEKSSDDGDARQLPAAAPWLIRSASFAGSVTRVAFPATRQEWALGSLSARRAAGTRLDDHPLVLADRGLRRGIELLGARRSDAFTRFDGNLSGCRELITDPTHPDAVSSPTRLEAWAQCPHRYLMQQVLRVDLVENPEELLQLSALDRGNLLHEACEQWLVEQLAGTQPPPNQPWSNAARDALVRLVEERCDHYAEAGLVGYPLLWGRDRRRLVLDCAAFLTQDDARRRDLGVVAVAAELAFGLRGSHVDPVPVTLPDGRTLRLAGKIDRLESGPEAIVVTDYKTGKSGAVKALLAKDAVGAGTKLQLPTYALAARAQLGKPTTPVRAEYWFMTTRGGFDRVGYDVDQSVLDRFMSVLTTIVDGIRDGLYPARPPAPGWQRYVECEFCDPDGLGTTERWGQWERKRRDPVLGGYLALAEPEVAAEPSAARQGAA